MEATESREIHILLVDDHPLVRRALRDILEKEPDLTVIAEAGDGQQAIEIATAPTRTILPRAAATRRRALTRTSW